MTITEAFKAVEGTTRRVRRAGRGYVVMASHMSFSPADLVANDWELEPVKRELSSEDIWRAANYADNELYSFVDTFRFTGTIPKIFISTMLKHLGFEK